MVEALITFLSHPGGYVPAVLFVVLIVVWTQRKKVVEFYLEIIARREAVRPQSNGALRDSLLNRLMEQTDDAHSERRSITQQLVLHAASTRELEKHSLDTMQGYLDIARMVSDRQTTQSEHLIRCLDQHTQATIELQKTVEAFAFLVSRLSFPGSTKSFADTMKTLGNQPDDRD